MADERKGKKERRGLLDWLRKQAEGQQTIASEAGDGANNTQRARLAATAPKADVLQRFVDQGEIGRGGMSSIRRVQDMNLLRDVAMKVLDPELARHPASLQGFLEEAQITGQLDHPNIVPVHEIGTDSNDTKYFTMKLVRGLTFSKWLQASLKERGSPQRLAEALDVFLKVCDAVSFAHARGVIHRDIKPDNIMVGRFGEVYLMDWGLAQIYSPNGENVSVVEVTRPPGGSKYYEGVVGTPAYMPPEQARGEVASIDERTDVFALGTVLYHVVVGRQPYRGTTVDEVLAKARECNYPSPEELVKDGLPPGIVRIIQRAMAANPADRYQNVVELKHDIKQFLQGGMHLPAKTFPAGTRIVIEGDTGDSAYIITRGHCEAYKMIDGQKRVLRRMGPGSVFGETAVISELPRTATVETLEEVTALVVTRAVLEEGLAMDTWMGAFVKALAHRFRDIDERLTQFERDRLAESIKKP